MKKLKISIGVMLFFIFFGGHSVFAESNSSFSENEMLKLENEINQIMNEELKNTIQSDNDNVTIEIGQASVKLEESTLELYDYNKEKIIEAFKQNAKELNQGLKNAKVDIEKNDFIQSNEFTPQTIVDRGSYYIAKVWAGVPGLGHGYINQDFRVVRSSSRFSNINLIGSSYKSGVFLSSWTHNRSWYEMFSSARSADIKMKGVLEYLFKGSPVALPATFKKTIHVHEF